MTKLKNEYTDYKEGLKEIIRGPEYDFLRENEHLGGNLIYLTLSGSRAYGTDTEASDIDIRGVAIEREEEILGLEKFEQYEDEKTDSIIYGIKKYVSLCCQCNPNVIELLGTRMPDTLVINSAGQLLRDNAELFLTKQAGITFTGYATAQLRRLQNALAHDSYSQSQKEKHIMESLKMIMMKSKEAYGINGSSLDFHLSDTDNEEKEIRINAELKDVSLRKFNRMNSDFANLLRNYDKLNHRNRKKDEAHLAKHAMHLIRLYYTGIDILNGKGIKTYREAEHEELMAIRNGKMTMEKDFELSEKLKHEMETAYNRSKLPETIDRKAVNELLCNIYRMSGF